MKGLHRMPGQSKVGKPAKKKPKPSRKAKAPARSASAKSESSADCPVSPPGKPESAYEQGVRDARVLFQNSSVFGHTSHRNLFDRYLAYPSIGNPIQESTFNHLDQTIADTHQLLSDLDNIIVDLDSFYSEIEEMDEKSKKDTIEKWEFYLNAYLKETKKMALLIEKTLSEIN